MDCRCKFCHKLLCKIVKNKKGVWIDGLGEEHSVLISDFVEAEIKCSKCKAKNIFKF